MIIIIIFYLLLRVIMQIYVKTLTGKTLTLDVEPCDIIYELKLKILDKEGYYHRNIGFAGHSLQDIRTL
jgi:ubiquitin C